MTRDELISRCCERIEITLDYPEQACAILDKMNFTDYKVVDKNKVHIYERLEETGDITMELAKNNIKIQGIGLVHEALEEYFFELTGGKQDA